MNEQLFVTLKCPSPMTLATDIDEKRRIVYRVMPSKIVSKLQSLATLSHRSIEPFTGVLGHGIRVVLTPLKRNKDRIKAELTKMEDKYNEVKAEIIDHWDEISKNIEDFNRTYNAERPTELNVDYINRRFSLQWNFLTYALPEEIRRRIFTEEELREIEKKIKSDIERVYQEKFSQKVAEFFLGVDKSLQRLKENKKVDKRLVRKLARLGDEITGLQKANDVRFIKETDILLFKGIEQTADILEKKLPEVKPEELVKEVKEAIEPSVKEFQIKLERLAEQESNPEAKVHEWLEVIKKINLQELR